MKCTNCRKKIAIVPITVRLRSGKLVGPFCEPCAEGVSSGRVKVREVNTKKEAA